MRPLGPLPRAGDGARERAKAAAVAADENALLLFGHDADHWRTLGLSPAFYI